MRFRIRHETVYRYAAPDIEPAPVARSAVLDAAGNAVEHAWFGAIAVD